MRSKTFVHIMYLSALLIVVIFIASASGQADEKAGAEAKEMAAIRRLGEKINAVDPPKASAEDICFLSSIVANGSNTAPNRVAQVVLLQCVAESEQMSPDAKCVARALAISFLWHQDDGIRLTAMSNLFEQKMLNNPVVKTRLREIAEHDERLSHREVAQDLLQHAKQQNANVL